MGQKAEFSQLISEATVGNFATVSGDYNPLHIDAAYAKTTEFGRPVVHGMYLAALFSRLVGMYLPGRRCLYLSQNLDFVRPVLVGDEVTVVGEVRERHETTRTLAIRTEIKTAQGGTVVRGKALVRVLA